MKNKVEKLQYIADFEKLGFGVFVHFGLYSILGKGEWYKDIYKIPMESYAPLIQEFKIKEDWAKELVQTAKDAGARYITLTTRHHDGFSLFDTCGLSDFDVMHSPTGRDLIKEFVTECNAAGIKPFFYHTLLDWKRPEYKTDFPKYLQYLRDSIEVLCTNYGKIGGFWFDGWWDKRDADWEFDRLYALIRKYQPTAMIINNTGLDECGKVGHKEIDSVTFERGCPSVVDCSEKYVAGEVCQGITDHWGYCEEDICFKSVPELLDLLADCRKFGHNLLLNTGLKGDGSVNPIEREIFRGMGKCLQANKNVFLDLEPSDITATNADILTDGTYHYAVIRGVPMATNTNVARLQESKRIVLDTDKKIVSAEWLDNGKPIALHADGTFSADPFEYGKSYYLRIAKLCLE